MAFDGWEAAVDRPRHRLSQLSQHDKIAIALHDFSSITDPDVVEFDYADGPNGVRGHYGATAFPSMLALAASLDRQLAAERCCRRGGADPGCACHGYPLCGEQLRVVTDRRGQPAPGVRLQSTFRCRRARCTRSTWNRFAAHWLGKAWPASWAPTTA